MIDYRFKAFRTEEVRLCISFDLVTLPLVLLYAEELSSVYFYIGIRYFGIFQPPEAPLRSPVHQKVSV